MQTSQNKKWKRSSERAETKVDVVHRSLRKLAFESGSNAKLPTIDEMCQSFETSRVTINEALQQLESQNVIFRQRGSGIYVSPKLFQKNIALIVRASWFRTDSASVFWDLLWSKFIVAAQTRSEVRQESLTIHTVRSKSGPEQPLDDHLAKLIEEGRVDAVLGIGLDYDTAEWIKAHGVPVIAFAGLGSYYVVVNMPEAARIGLKHLIGLGCRSIRMWASGFNDDVKNKPHQEGELEHDAYTDLRVVFQEVMEAHSLPYSDELFWSYDGSSDPPHQQGYNASERLIHQGLVSKTDGLLIMNDVMAMGALKAMRSHGKGQNIEIVSHANRDSSVLYAYDDQITRLEFDPNELVRLMFNLLDRVLAGQLPESDTITLGPSSLLLPSRKGRIKEGN